VLPYRPKGHFLLGNSWAFQHQRLSFLLSLPQYGDLTYMRLGREAVYVLHHPDLIRQVLVEQPDHFQKLRLTRSLFNRALRGASDVQLRKTEAWQHRREIVQAAFHAVQVDTYARGMIEQTQAFLASPAWQPGQSINIYQQMRVLTLRIASRVLFGASFSPTQLEAIMDATNALQQRASKRFNAFFSLPLWMPTRSNTRIRAAINTLDGIVEALSKECAESSNPRGDLLATLVYSSSHLQIEAIREELISLLMSSHETTATALTWVFYMISQHPEVEQKLRDEIQQGLRGGEMPSIAGFPYAAAVIKEAMRLYPPSWVISRRTVETTTIGEYPIPAKALVYIVSYSLHRDPRWFDEPEQFRPERFLPEDQIRRYTYLPFGTGPRKCIGSSFAMLETLLLLVTITQCVHLKLIPGQRIVPEALITLRPQYGIRMKVSRA